MMVIREIPICIKLNIKEKSDRLCIECREKATKWVFWEQFENGGCAAYFCSKHSLDPKYHITSLIVGPVGVGEPPHKYFRGDKGKGFRPKYPDWVNQLKQY